MGSHVVDDYTCVTGRQRRRTCGGTVRTGPHRWVQAIFGATLIAFSLMPALGWEPPPVRPAAEALQQALFASGYIIPVVLVVYFAVGLSWLLDRFVPLAAIVLFPVSLNIVLFHSMLNRTPFSLTAAFGLFAVNLFMLYSSRAAYRPLLAAR